LAKNFRANASLTITGTGAREALTLLDVLALSAGKSEVLVAAAAAKSAEVKLRPARNGRCRTSEDQAGDIGASDQQHQPYCRHSEVQHGSDLTDFTAKRLLRGQQPDGGRIRFLGHRLRTTKHFVAEDGSSGGLSLAK
jgi:hypothetical protein